MKTFLHANRAARSRRPRGFRAAGVAAGIKANGKKDMALIVSDAPATVAATFTTNQVKAAPVKLEHAAREIGQGLRDRRQQRQRQRLHGRSA